MQVAENTAWLNLQKRFQNRSTHQYAFQIYPDSTLRTKQQSASRNQLPRHVRAPASQPWENRTYPADDLRRKETESQSLQQNRFKLIECLCDRPSPAVSFSKQRNSTPTWCFTIFRASFYRCTWQHHIYQPQDLSKQRDAIGGSWARGLFWKSLKSLGAATPGGCHQIAWWLGSVADDFVRPNPQKFSWDVWMVTCWSPLQQKWVSTVFHPAFSAW